MLSAIAQEKEQNRTSPLRPGEVSKCFEHLNTGICEYLNTWNSLMVLFNVSADARIDTHQVKLARR